MQCLERAYRLNSFTPSVTQISITGSYPGVDKKRTVGKGVGEELEIQLPRQKGICKSSIRDRGRERNLACRSHMEGVWKRQLALSEEKKVILEATGSQCQLSGK